MTLVLYKAWAWCRDHAWLFAAVGGSILIWVLTAGRRKAPGQVLTAERAVVQAKAEARKVEAELGAAKAVAQIKEQHAAKLEQLDTKQKERVRELENDPEALVAALMRASK